MTWRWKAFSMRLTPTRPSRTNRLLRRDIASCSDHVGAGEPVVQAALLAVEADPQEAEAQRRSAREVSGAAHEALCRRRRVAVNIDDRHLHDLHAERAAAGDLEHEQIGQADRRE